MALTGIGYQVAGSSFSRFKGWVVTLLGVGREGLEPLHRKDAKSGKIFRSFFASFASWR
jgi:hypothetical protein